MQKNILTFICCSVFLIITTKCFNFVFWDTLLNPAFHFYALFHLAVLAYGVVCMGQINLSNVWGGKYLKWVMFLPLIAEVFKLFLYGRIGQSESVETIAMSAGISTFFIMYKHRININMIFAATIIFGLVGFIIQYGENFLNFDVLFGIRNIDDVLNSRYDTGFNIQRISVCSQLLPCFGIYYFWNKFINSGKWLNLIPFAIFLAFLYLLQNRQTMIAVGLTLLFTPIISGKKGSVVYPLLGSIVLVYLLSRYGEMLFGAIVDSTKSDTYSWDTRMAEIPYFLKQSVLNPIALFLGHGSQFDMHIVNGYAMYTNDVGFVGELYQNGLIYVILYFRFLYQVFKERRLLPNLLVFYVFSTSIHSLFIFPYRQGLTAFLWIILIYLANMQLSTERSNA